MQTNYYKDIRNFKEAGNQKKVKGHHNGINTAKNTTPSQPLGFKYMSVNPEVSYSLQAF